MTTTSISKCSNGYLVSSTSGIFGIDVTETWVFVKLEDAMDKVKLEMSNNDVGHITKHIDWVDEELERIDKPIEEE
jgi:hypothetical protein